MRPVPPWRGVMASALPAARHPWACPECARPLVATGGCLLCPSCGHSPCG